jgi:hypothetical protein
MQVRFRFDADGRGFDRALLVFGERRWEKKGAVAGISEPEPFLRMPLSRDMAFGGKGHAANPVGLGFATFPPRGPVPLPHLEDPAQRIRTPRQTPPPASFSPAAAADLAEGRDMASRSLPEAFDWTAFQAAPREQRTAYLRGDEPFLLEGLHPQHPVFEGALPGLRARCFAERPRGPEEIPMLLDTAFFDLDERTLTLVWRGVVPVLDELAPDIRSLRLTTAKSSDTGGPD